VPDVFISYAHEDAELAQRLGAALRDRDREVWLDRSTDPETGIVPASDWNASALDGIDRSDAFLFVLSPSSLASKPCRGELAHAISVNKRLLPVCAADPSTDADVPESLRPLSWVMLRPGVDSFDTGVEALMRALDTDLEVIREHTRILVRARAWELGQRRASPLLRGDELRAAEEWLGRAASVRVTPTEVQREFILASRRSASRRQRIAVTGSLAVAAVAIALSVFALIQRSHARHQATLANARALAANAQALLQSDPEQSIQVAAQAVRRFPTPQAIHALSTALSTSRLRAVLDNGDSAVEAVAFSPDGRELAVGSADGTVRLWRMDGRRVVWTEGGGGGTEANSLSFTADGRELVDGRSSPSFQARGCSTDVLDAATGAVRRTLGSTSVGNCSQFVGVLGSTRDVALSTGTGVVGVWDLDDGRLLGPRVQELTEAHPTVKAFAVSDGGRRLGVVGGSTVAVVDLSPGHELAPGGPALVLDRCWCGRTSHDALHAGFLEPGGAAFSPDGSALLVTTGDLGDQPAIYYLGAGVSAPLYAQNEPAAAAAWAQDGRVLAAAGSFGVLDVWSSGSQLLETFRGSGTGDFTAVALTANGMLAAGTPNGSVRVWSADPDRPDATIPISNLTGEGLIATAPAAGIVAAGDASTHILLLDPSGHVVNILKPRGNAPFAAAGRVLAYTRNGHADVVELPSGKLMRSPRLPATAADDVVQQVAVSADGNVVVVLYDDLLVRLGPNGDVAKRRVPKTFASAQVSVSPDGRLVSLSLTSGTQVLDPQLDLIRTIPGISAAFAPGGSLLAVLQTSGAIELLRTSDWRLQAAAHGSAPLALQPNTLAFSRNGRLLAAIGGDGDLRIWDTADGSAVGTRQVFAGVKPNGFFPPVALTADGRAFVADDWDTQNAILVYDVCDQCLDPKALLHQADTRLTQIAPVSAMH
jgi:WD40 repeat protein